DDYISLGDIGDSSPNLTVSAWVYAESFDNMINTVIGKESTTSNHSWVLRFGDSGLEANRLQWVISEPGDLLGATNKLAATTLANTKPWYPVAATYDSNGRMALYIDGVLTAENPSGANGQLQNSSVNTDIGRSTGGADRWWDGYIDDVRIYNRGLSA